MTEFGKDFVDQMETGAEALEGAGYDIIKYHGNITSDSELIQGIGDTPDEALENTLSELESRRDLFFHVTSDEFSKALQGEQDAESLLYRNLRGVIEIDEPMTDEPSYANEPIPAFQTEIRYIPDQPDYWEVSTGVTRPPYTQEDTEQHLRELVQVFEQAGIEVENKGSHGIEYLEEEIE